MTPSQELSLIDFAKSILGQPFAYGSNDCPLMAAGALDCMDGGDRRGLMRGLWHNQKTAWRYALENGTIADHLRREGCTEVSLAFAAPGDFILMERTLAHDRQWHSVAVCMGDKAMVMTEEHGAIMIDMASLPPVTEVLRWQ